jgi:ELWxxDGT repeat protein
VDPHELTSVGDRLFYVVEDGVHGVELWTSDGTPVGTELVEDLDPEGSSAPRLLTAFGETLAFVACHPQATCWALYLSDGTPEGTAVVDGIENVGDLTVVGTALLMTGRDPAWLHAGELYILVP